jgi:hypothetical protein
MGFLKSFGRILSGKPAYEPGDFTQADQPQQTQLPDGQPVAPGSPAPSPPSQGPKVVPVVRITRVECPVNGSRMDIYGDIRNESSVPVTLDKVLLQGDRRELDRRLNPGEAHQCLLYSGPLLQNIPNGYADVQFFTADSDYFSARHQIRVQQQPDKTFRITEFLLTMPIHDMR